MKRINFSVFSGVVLYYTDAGLQAMGGSYAAEKPRHDYLASQWNNYHRGKAYEGKTRIEQERIAATWVSRPYEPSMDKWVHEMNKQRFAEAFPPTPGVCHVFILTWYQLPDFKEYMKALGWDKYIMYEAPPAANRNYPNRNAASPYLRNTLVIVNYPEEVNNA